MQMKTSTSSPKEICWGQTIYHLLQKKFVGVKPFIAANKTKEN
jgi:hypothetical protein